MAAISPNRAQRKLRFVFRSSSPQITRHPW
jgi:hypothetical protein